MNFDYMPELKRHYGYHTVMGPCFNSDWNDYLF
jgi:Mg2+ and Co2+ transporter CorA